MKQIYLNILIFSLLLLSCMSASAIEMINDIYYTLNDDNHTAYVTYRKAGKVGNVIYGSRSIYKGDVVIPSEISVNNQTYKVTAIEEQAFSNAELTSLTIPSTIDSLASTAFSGCKSFEKLIINDLKAWCEIKGQSYNNPIRYAQYLYLGDEILTNINIPDGTTHIGDYSFYQYENLESVHIPSSLTTIGFAAFEGCTKLNEIIIPQSVEVINKYAFSDCNSLKTLHIDSDSILGKEETGSSYSNSSLSNIFGNYIEECYIGTNVKKIKDYAFCNFHKLQYVSMGDNVEHIGDRAFYGCNSLAAIYISKYMKTIGNSAFSGCSNLERVRIKSLSNWMNIDFQSSYSNPLELAHKLFITDGPLVSDTEITEINANDFGSGLTRIKPYAFINYTGLTHITIPNTIESIGGNAFQGCTGLTSISIPNSVTSIGYQAFSGCTNLESVDLPDNIISCSFDKGVRINVNKGTKTLLALWQAGLTPYEKNTENKLEAPTVSVKSKTQTTVTLKIDNIDISNEYVYYTTKDYNWNNEGTSVTYSFSNPIINGEFTLGNMYPSNISNAYIYVTRKQNQDVYYETYGRFETLPITPTVNPTRITASSIAVTGSFIEGDAKVISQEIMVNNITGTGNKAQATGLDPSSSYPARYTITVAYGEDGTSKKLYSTGSIDSRGRITNDKTIMTQNLALNTLQPKIVSPGNAIVAAESNLDDEETNVGFEWRRTDWTDDFASNTGGVYLYEGTMEGYIRNLNTEKLWKVRPYYESNSGNRYYGEWVGLDPTNTSYFEPTVHTYAAVSVDGNKARVKGYVMRGSDNITSQGFKYWPSDANARAEAGSNGSVPSSAVTVTGSGNVMEVEFTGLNYETTYTYVTFVTTSEGETFYGEQRTFTSGANPTGIEAVVSSSNEVAEAARYDLRGRKLAAPQRGINIIRMSDGTTRKVMVK